MRTIINPIIIFSVFKSDLDILINLKNHKEVLNQLAINKIPYKVVQGQYGGQTENSIICHKAHLKTVKQLALIANQESILIRERDKQCYLIDLKSDNLSYVGQWTEVTPAQAYHKGNFTYDQSKNKFYSTI